MYIYLALSIAFLFATLATTFINPNIKKDLLNELTPQEIIIYKNITMFRLKIYYQDTDSSQWVDASPPLAPALSSNAPATASSAGSEGDIRFDSGYVYVCIATNTWKRAALTTW